MAVRVRFAPSPTGSLHLGNALSAVANRVYADAQGGTLVLRIDDTDPARVVEGGEEAVRLDLDWLGVAVDEGPVRQSERGTLYAGAAARMEQAGTAARDADGSLRLARGPRTTLLRPDGSATYQLASVVDDLDLRITHVIRGSDHRPNLPVQQAIAEGLGARLPEVVHHGLLLGEDGKKLSKRHGHSSLADLREEGYPPEAVHAYLEELGVPEHDVHLDLHRLTRLAVDALAALSDEELSARVNVPVAVAPAVRGARTLVEARELARQVLETPSVALGEEARPTLERFAELRAGANGDLGPDGARAIVRELKVVGGDLKVLRLALTGADAGPALWAVLAALPADEALRRARAAL